MGLLVIITFVAAAMLGRFIVDRTRSTALRSFAKARHFGYLGGDLPVGFHIRDALLYQAHSIANVIFGSKNNKEFVVFDCAFSLGKGRYPLTVIGVRGLPGNVATFGVGPNSKTETAGQWLLAWHQGRLSIDQIDDHLSDI